VKLRLRPVAVATVGAAATLSAATSAYLLILLAAAVAAARRTAPSGEPLGGRPAFVVLVPAHDEVLNIEAAVAALRAQTYTGSSEVIVLADNCHDRTAELGAAAGATVWERTEPDERGKGHVLAWALGRLAHERPDIDAVAMVDADCVASPGLLEAAGARLAAGGQAVQASYGVSNPDASTTAAGRYAGFALINHVRPLGKSALGLSCGLLGSGMAFDSSLLREIPWRSFGVTEDGEYHLKLVERGVRVDFAPEASVVSAMPTTTGGAEVQRERWEGGQWRLVRDWAWPLVVAGLRDRDLNRVHAALELLVLPQSLLLAGGVSAAGGAVALRARRTALVATAGVAGQIVFVVGGLVLFGAPARVYRALALAPALAARNARTYARLAARRRPPQWNRTPREAPAADAPLAR